MAKENLKINLTDEEKAVAKEIWDINVRVWLNDKRDKIQGGILAQPTKWAIDIVVKHFDHYFGE